MKIKKKVSGLKTLYHVKFPTIEIDFLSNRDNYLLLLDGWLTSYRVLEFFLDCFQNAVNAVAKITPNICEMGNKLL